ncbi:MAG TPA: caspase family protein [Gemmataceae bacterium]|jgi:hypothetical protein|nr:caspase family protein [Gemmataceae bacterium]
MRGALLALVSVVQCVPSVASAQEGRRYAVLVGVNTYDHEKLPALKYAVNDAAELGRLLEKAGYDVTVLSDDAGKTDSKLAPTKKNIEHVLKVVLERAKKGDLVVIAFAGHGVQFEGEKDAYFCPTDAKPVKSKTETLLSLTKVYEEIDGSFAGMKVLLVDACRDDPQAGRGSRGVSADAAPRPPQGVAAIFSCRAGQRAFEFDKYKHGVFFHHLLTGLRGEATDKKGRVTFAALASHVGTAVPADVARLVGGGAVQTPNIRADYAYEPVLLSAPVGTDAPASGEEQVVADLRAYERATSAATVLPFLKRETPLRIQAWKDAALRGSVAGQVLLGCCYSKGVGVDADDSQAVAWFRKAAEAGSPEGMGNLAFMFMVGRGVTQDSIEAAKWARKAANAGNPRSMANLGAMYAAGQGVEKDEREAIAWYQKAADSGDARAMAALGSAFEFGRGMAVNLTEAIAWYRRSANAGAGTGMTSLGIMFGLGRGVERNDERATEWFRKAADAGDIRGMFCLGVQYENGRGIEQDLNLAVAWYRKAAELGSGDAKEALRRLGK